MPKLFWNPDSLGSEWELGGLRKGAGMEGWSQGLASYF